eukprot:Gb_03892 [translate_table: standard]
MSRIFIFKEAFDLSDNFVACNAVYKICFHVLFLNEHASSSMRGIYVGMSVP